MDKQNRGGRGNPRGENNRPPLQGEALERSLANLTHPPGEAHIVHGFFARPGALMKCARCPVSATCADCDPDGSCRLEAAYLSERKAALLTIGHLDPVTDGPAIAALLWTEVRLHRAARYMAEKGELDPASEETGNLAYTPVARDSIALMGSWQTQLKTLGVTPSERRRLAGSGEGGLGAALAQALAGLTQRDADERKAGAVDGDFTAEGVTTDAED